MRLGLRLLFAFFVVAGLARFFALQSGPLAHELDAYRQRPVDADRVIGVATVAKPIATVRGIRGAGAARPVAAAHLS